MNIEKLNINIVGFGGYIPTYRIKVEEIAKTLNQDPESIINSLFLEEKTVPAKDEDTITISTQAAKNAIARAQIIPNFNKLQISAIYIGSESHPYAVKPSSTVVSQALGLSEDITTVDTQFACKAGTGSLQLTIAITKANMADYAIAIGADTSQSKPGDILEYSAAAGGAAIIVANPKKIPLNLSAAKIQYTISKTSNTPDFWRRNTQLHPEHTGRFTGEPAYFKHITETTQLMLEKTGFKISDFHHIIFHQPNGKFPLIVAKKLNVSNQQLKYGMLVNKIGNTYSGSSMLGLTNVLENAKPNEKILLTSYGSGAGSDCFVLETSENISAMQKSAATIQQYILNKKYISYPQYRKHMEQIA